jgi:hypothetical protein
LDNRVLGLVEVAGGMLVFRVITAAHMAANFAEAQMYPGAAHLQTFLTAFTAWHNILDLNDMLARFRFAHWFTLYSTETTVYAFCEYRYTSPHSGRPGWLLGCRFVYNPFLHPYDLRSNFNRLIHNRRHEFAGAEYQHQVNRNRNRGQVRVCILVQDSLKARIDRQDVITLALQIGRNSILLL